MASPIRRAFSLLELLVVMGILLLVASLGIAAFQRVGTVNRLTATEHLIADMVRQARLTARTSGSPVVLNVIRGTAGTAASISGVSRTVLWSEGFEKTDFTVPILPQSVEDFRTRVGRTGAGFSFSDAARSAPRFPDPIATTPTGSPDTKKNALTRRGGTSNSEGFSLSVAVRPPVINIGATDFPLVMVATNQVANATACVDVKESICGLRLEAWTRSVIIDQNERPTRKHEHEQTALVPNPTKLDPQHRFWAITGWIVPEGSTTPILINSENNTLLTLTPQQHQGQTEVDIGGHWEEITLLYDGHNLQLLRDGVPIARRIADTPTHLDGAQRLAGYGQPQQVILGNAKFSGSWLQGGVGSLDAYLPSSAILDDVCLARMGIDLPHALPSGMVPDADYQITVTPVGTFTVNGGTTTNALVFHGTAEEAELTTTITINPTTGAVTSTELKVKP